MDFSVRLENLVEEKNITQKQLSIELHIAPTTLNGYINNYREPDFHTLVRLPIICLGSVMRKSLHLPA